MGNLETNGDDRPMFPPMINSITIVENPFPDIVPRYFWLVLEGMECRKLEVDREETNEETEKTKKKIIKDKKLLSFDDHDELDDVIIQNPLRIYLFYPWYTLVKGIKPSSIVMSERRKRRAEEEERKKKQLESELMEKQQQQEEEERRKREEEEAARRPYWDLCSIWME